MDSAVVDRVIELFVGAAEPRQAYPPGESDRRRATEAAKVERLAAAGILDESAKQEILASLDEGLDYQRDHPHNEIDDKLDDAFALVEQVASPQVITAIAGLIDLRVRKRLATYSQRCAARVIGGGDEKLARAGLLAQLLVAGGKEQDSRDLAVSLAPIHVAAENSAGGAAALFAAIARLAPESMRSALVEFGARTDVTLEAFGWRLSAADGDEWIVLSD